MTNYFGQPCRGGPLPTVASNWVIVVDIFHFLNYKLDFQNCPVGLIYIGLTYIT